MNFFQCESCPKIYKSRHSLHIHRHNIHSDSPGKKPYTCDVCNKQYEAKVAFEKHKKAHLNPLQCDICGTKTTSLRTLNHHTHCHRIGKVCCKSCGKFYKSERIDEHMSTCWPNQSTSGDFQGRVNASMSKNKQLRNTRGGGDGELTFEAQEMTARSVAEQSYPGIDVEIPLELLAASQVLSETEHMEMTGQIAMGGSNESPIKLSVVKRTEALHIALEASELGAAFQQLVTGRWQCSFDAAYITNEADVQESDPNVDHIDIDLVTDANNDPQTCVIPEVIVEGNFPDISIPSHVIIDVERDPSEPDSADKAALGDSATDSPLGVTTPESTVVKLEVLGGGEQASDEPREPDEIDDQSKSEVHRLSAESTKSDERTSAAKSKPLNEQRKSTERGEAGCKSETSELGPEVAGLSKITSVVGRMLHEVAESKDLVGDDGGAAVGGEIKAVQLNVRTRSKSRASLMPPKKSGRMSTRSSLDSTPSKSTPHRNKGKGNLDGKKKVSKVASEEKTLESECKQTSTVTDGNEQSAGDQEDDWTPKTPVKKRKAKRPSDSFSSPKKRWRAQVDDDEEGDYASKHGMLTQICEQSKVLVAGSELSSGQEIANTEELCCIICNKTFSMSRRCYFSSHIRDLHEFTLSRYLKLLQMTDVERKKLVQERLDQESQIQLVYKAKKYNKKEGDLIKCHSCKTVIAGIPAYRTHIMTTHRSDADYNELSEKVEAFCEERITNRRTDIIANCPYCQKAKNGLQAMKTHLRLSHTNEADVLWQIKQQQLYFKSLYNQYRRKLYRKALQVDKKVTYKCVFCDDVFAFRSSRSRHMKFSCDNNPDRKKLLTCSYCDQKFENRPDLDEHRAKHKAENFKWVCDECGLTRSTRAGIYEHKRHHHNKNPPSHQCPHCDKAFYNRERWDRHLTVHSNERNYQCDMCGNNYKTKAAVSKHQRAVHFNKYKYRCDDCGHGMQKLQYLKTHVCGRVRRNQESDSKTNLDDVQSIMVKTEKKLAAEGPVIEDEVAANYLIDLNPQGALGIGIPLEGLAPSGPTQEVIHYIKPLVQAAEVEYGSHSNKSALEKLEDSEMVPQSLKYEETTTVVEETVGSHGQLIVTTVPMSSMALDGLQPQAMQAQQIDLPQTSGTLDQLQQSTTLTSVVPMTSAYTYHNTYGGLQTMGVLDYSHGSPQVIVQYSDQPQS